VNPPTTALAALLSDLCVRNVELRVDGNRLRCRPREALTDLLTKRIRDAKDELMSLLAGAGDRSLTAGELLVLAKAGASAGDVPQVLAAKDAFASLGGLTLTEFTPSPDGANP